MSRYDNDVLGVGNSLHPANKVTVLDDAVEQMTELEFVEYERNLYQNKAILLQDKLDSIKIIVSYMSNDIGWKSILLRTIE